MARIRRADNTTIPADPDHPDGPADLHRFAAEHGDADLQDAATAAGNLTWGNPAWMERLCDQSGPYYHLDQVRMDLDTVERLGTPKARANRARRVARELIDQAERACKEANRYLLQSLCTTLRRTHPDATHAQLERHPSGVWVLTGITGRDGRPLNLPPAQQPHRDALLLSGTDWADRGELATGPDGTDRASIDLTRVDRCSPGS